MHVRDRKNSDLQWNLQNMCWWLKLSFSVTQSILEKNISLHWDLWTAHSKPEGWAAIQNSLTSHRDEPTGAFRNSTAIKVKPCTWGWKTQQTEQERGGAPWHTQGSHSSVHSRSTPEHSTVWGSSCMSQQLLLQAIQIVKESGAIALERKGQGNGPYPAWQRQGFTNTAFQYPQKGNWVQRAKLFTAVGCARAEDTRYSLKQEGLRLHTSQNIFIIKTIKPQGRLPRQAVQSPALEIFKTSLGSALSNPLQPQADHTFHRRLY